MRGRGRGLKEMGRALIRYAGSALKASTDSMPVEGTELKRTDHSLSGSGFTCMLH